MKIDPLKPTSYVNTLTGKEILQISFSGGRTSGYMTKMLIDRYSDEYDFIVTFANTGREHPKTLEFVRNCDEVFGFNTVWLEAVMHYGIRKAPTHRVVSFETANRDGRVFEDFIRKAGVPNKAFPQCTRDLKLNPMKSYLKSLGIKAHKVKTAVGIREDEKRRVAKSAEAECIVYPLIDWFPSDKKDVLDWWAEQPFDLEIDEFEGNCLACFKKSQKKLFMQIERDASVFDWTMRMEDTYRRTGPQDGERVFFRQNVDTRLLLKMFDEVGGASGAPVPDSYEDGGCSESCEVYETLISGEEK